MSEGRAEERSTPLSHTVFKFFFASHIPATAIVDIQVLMPKEWVAPFARKLLDYYTANTQDALMLTRPVWFKSLIALEVAFQFPFFFVAVYAFHKRKNWIRLPSIIYASHAVTQMAPILSTVLFDSAIPDSKRAMLTCVYLPYLAIPLWLLAHMSRNQEPFGPQDKNLKIT
mmetsp:Transcript_104170/g.167887  ORF Transcript_104170/g.167887 Transcript_104170/m.167887 type:complete len:171 (+) Transcript_104170:85-597(+)